MKKSMKSAIALMLALIMVLSLNTMTFASEFSDVPSTIGTEYLDAINYMCDNYLMEGTASFTFTPNRAVLRADVAMLLFRLSGDDGVYTNNFTDVPLSAYYYNAVGWAAQYGIVNGVSTTLFAPTQAVTKEQLITMFYRFATYKGFDVTPDESITSASDYASVSVYARDPLKWAYSYGILVRTQNSSAIYPQSQVPRKDLALYGHRYRTHVEGLVFERDRFSFENSAQNLKSGSISGGTRYLISQADWDRFLDYCEQAGGFAETMTANKLMTLPWGGSCFGLAITTALDYLGKIDLNGNYCTTTGTMYEIPAPILINDIHHRTTTDFQNNSITISKVESKINLYQFSQFTKEIAEWIPVENANVTLNKMLDGQKHGGIGIFCFLTNDGPGGHAINVYGKPEQTFYGYRIAAYDNNYSDNEPAYIKIYDNGDTYSGEFVKGNSVCLSLSGCTYENDFEKYKKLDIDGDFNIPPIESNSNEEILEEYSLIYVRSSGHFVIENEGGEEIRYSSAGISGEIDTYRQTFVPAGEVCDFFFVVPHSEFYTCTAIDDAEIDCFLVSNNAGTDEAAISNDPTEILTVQNPMDDLVISSE